MTANIVSFPSNRFSAVDAERLREIESIMIAIGAWGRVQYLEATPGPGFDMVLIYSPASITPSLVIKRHGNGIYMLIDPVAMMLSAKAKSLEDLLAPLEPIIRVADTADDRSGRRISP